MDDARVELAGDDDAPLPPAQVAAMSEESDAKSKRKGKVELMQDEEGGPGFGPGTIASAPDALDKKMAIKGASVAPKASAESERELKSSPAIKSVGARGTFDERLRDKLQSSREDDDSIHVPAEEEAESETRGWDDIRSTPSHRRENPSIVNLPGSAAATRPPPPSMMPREPSAPLLTATLVTDEPDPVIDAVAVRIEENEQTPWWRKHQKGILLALTASLLAIVALAAVLGTTLSSQNEDDSPAAAPTAPPIPLLVAPDFTFFPTYSPTASFRPTSSMQLSMQTSAVQLVPHEKFVPLSTIDEWVHENVAVYGDTAVVGAPANGNEQGVAFVFVKGENGEWLQQAKLEDPGGADWDKFGISVDIDDETIIIGSIYDEGGVGSAHVFLRTGAEWTYQARLVAPGGDANEWFGQSVGVHGNYAVVSAHGDCDNGFQSGSAHIFVRSGDAWSYQAKLLAPDGQPLDYFGHSVGIYNNYVVVGAHGDDGNAGPVSDLDGSAHVFVRTGVDWQHQAKLVSPNGVTGDQFGESVGIYGEHIVAGAHWDAERGIESGAAHVFVRSGSEWNHQVKLLAPDQGIDYFGSAVAIHGSQILVGAHYVYGVGSAYVFVRDQKDWLYKAKLVVPHAAVDDYWGRSVAIHNRTALVGSVQGAYVFSDE